MNFEEIGQQFLSAYYGAMQGTAEERTSLKSLYAPTSVLYQDGKRLYGPEIITKLDRIAHNSKFEYVNVEPVIMDAGDGILICVTGTKTLVKFPLHIPFKS